MRKTVKISLALIVLVLCSLACGSSGTTSIPTTQVRSELTVDKLEDIKTGMTDLQWDNYTEELVGEVVYFSGSIIEVSQDGSVQISDGDRLMTVCVLYGIPRDVAITLNKDTHIAGTGTVREAATFLGSLQVRIDVDEIE